MAEKRTPPRPRKHKGPVFGRNRRGRCRRDRKRHRRRTRTPQAERKESGRKRRRRPRRNRIQRKRRRGNFRQDAGGRAFRYARSHCKNQARHDENRKAKGFRRIFKAQVVPQHACGNAHRRGKKTFVRNRTRADIGQNFRACGQAVCCAENQRRRQSGANCGQLHSTRRKHSPAHF